MRKNGREREGRRRERIKEIKQSRKRGERERKGRVDFFYRKEEKIRKMSWRLESQESFRDALRDFFKKVQ